METTTDAQIPVPTPGANGYPLPDQPETEGGKSRLKLVVVVGTLIAVALVVLLTAGLYALGDSSQSALERLRDIAVIYIVLMSLILVIIMAVATAAMVYLVMQIKGRVIPLLEEMTGTLERVRGTTEFMTEEAVKPVINAAGKVAQWKAMIKVATGRTSKR